MEVDKMLPFKNILARTIKRKTKTKEEFQETIAQWLLSGYLTEDEVNELLILLDEVFGTT